MLQLRLWCKDTQTKGTHHFPWCGDDTYALGWGIIKPQAQWYRPKPFHSMVAVNTKNNLFAKGGFEPGMFVHRIL
jgi:hypothetical protein